MLRKSAGYSIRVEWKGKKKINRWEKYKKEQSPIAISTGWSPRQKFQRRSMPSYSSLSSPSSRSSSSPLLRRPLCNVPNGSSRTSDLISREERAWELPSTLAFQIDASPSTSWSVEIFELHENMTIYVNVSIRYRMNIVNASMYHTRYWWILLLLRRFFCSESFLLVTIFQIVFFPSSPRGETERERERESKKLR